MECRGLSDIEWRVRAFMSVSLVIYTISIMFLLRGVFIELGAVFDFLFDYVYFLMPFLFCLYYFLIPFLLYGRKAKIRSKALGYTYIISTIIIPTFIIYVSVEVLN